MRVNTRSITLSRAARARNERSHLRQNHDQGGLPQISRLPTHVRPGQQQNVVGAAVQEKIVRHKPIAPPGHLLLLDDRMPPSTNFQFAAVLNKFSAGNNSRSAAMCAIDASTSTSARASAVCRILFASAAIEVRKRGEQPPLDLDIFSCASRIFASYSFNSGVVKRSALTSVCLRSSVLWRQMQLGLEISM